MERENERLTLEIGFSPDRSLEELFREYEKRRGGREEEET